MHLLVVDACVTITVLVLVFHRVSVSRSQDIPFFGPTIPEDAAFDKNEIFREFMLTKRMLHVILIASFASIGIQGISCVY